jgi:hypothetical protein
MAKIRRRKKISPPAPPGGYGKGGTAQIGDDAGFWLAAGEMTGSPNAQQGPLWGANSSSAINGAVQTIMVETPRQNLVAAAAPNRQRLAIDFIDGQVDVIPWLYGGGNDIFCAYVGVYVGEYVSGTNLYDAQDPSNPAEVSREWLYIEGRMFAVSATPATSVNVVTPSTHSCFNLTGAVDVVLEGGEALMLAYATSGLTSGNTAMFGFNIRLHFAEQT